MSTTTRISRRTVLRGMGTALSLPLLEAMDPATARAGLGNQPAGKPPKRMAYLFVPNGVNLSAWTPQQEGFNYDLPFILAPLARIKDKVNVLTGLTHDKGRNNGDGPGDHARSAGVFLTATQPRKTSGESIEVGISVDQVAAQSRGDLTRFPSLELGCESGRNSGSCDSGYSCAYSHNISWSSPSTPLAKEVNPKLVFERLFSNDSKSESEKSRGERDHFRKSLLDYVSEDAKRLQEKLGRTDQRKLDEYLTSVREIERRITADNGSKAASKVDLSRYPRPAGIPKEYAEHIRLMCDMMVLAFQADLTRVATCMFARAGSNKSYSFIGVPEGHHHLSHHGRNETKLAKIRQINRFHVSQLVYLLERLDSIPEGDGTLLDHCMIVYGSGLSDGDRHNNEDLPVLLAGGGGGTILSGRHIRYPQETPMSNLFVSLLNCFDVPVDSFGDSTGRLPYLG